MTKRAATYIRVSTSNQAKNGNGLEAQASQCRAMVTMKGWEDAGTWSDNGVSGASDASKRPGLSGLMEACRAHEVDVIVVASLSRLGRSTRKVLALGDELGRLGVDLVSCSESIDTTTASGRFVFTVFAALGELEREFIRERVMGGQAERDKLDGNMGGSVPYGYRRVPKTKPAQVTVDPTAAAVVKRIFRLRGKGSTLRAIADALNADSITGARGSVWYPGSVSNVLRCEAQYRGGKRGASQRRWPVILKGSAK